jgi:hypothetical protein
VVGVDVEVGVVKVVVVAVGIVEELTQGHHKRFSILHHNCYRDNVIT